MKFTDIGKKLLSEDEGERSEAAKKYTRLTDYVIDRIMESTLTSMKKVDSIIMHGGRTVCFAEFCSRYSVLVIYCMRGRYTDVSTPNMWYLYHG